MERWKHWPKNFHPKPMDSVEFGTRRLEFGAQLLQCSANDFSLKELTCGDGGHGHIWIFFCDTNPPITLLLTFCPGFKFPESGFFIFCSVCLFQILNNKKKYFFLKKSNWLFADGLFPLCRPVARASNVLHDVVFYQRPTRVLPIPRPLFCLRIRQCSLSGFCPNKNDFGPLLVLPAESVIWSIALDLDNQPTSVTVFSRMVGSTAAVRNLMHVDDHSFDQVLTKSWPSLAKIDQTLTKAHRRLTKVLTCVGR